MASDRMDPSARRPAWYPDPDRPDRLRYWDGSRWADRRRPRPRWSTDGPPVLPVSEPSALEGPARTVELPAPATGRGSTRQVGPSSPTTADTAPGVPSPADGPPPPPHPAGRPPGPPGGPSGSGGGDEGGGGGRPRGGRRRWLVLTAVAVLATGMVWVVGKALVPAAHGPRVVNDRHFISLANAQCSKTLPTLRPAEEGPLGTPVTPAQAADGADKAADGMVQLADSLRSLPADPAARPYIDSWLDGWLRYAGLGHQWATFIRQHPTTVKPSPPLLAGIAHEASNEENFALANGLSACSFVATPTVDPSTGF